LLSTESPCPWLQAVLGAQETRLLAPTTGVKALTSLPDWPPGVLQSLAVCRKPFVVSLSNHEPAPFDKLRSNG